jgi:hypothetical protein
MWAFGETRPYSRLENGARSQIHPTFGTLNWHKTFKSVAIGLKRIGIRD